MKKRNLMFVILAIVLVTIFIFLATIFTLSDINPGSTSQPNTSISTTKKTSSEFKIKYEKGSLGKSLLKLTTRIPLSQDDLDIKNKLVERSNSNNGLIFLDTNYSIEYVSAIDDIEIEILTTDVEKAKAEALNYLKKQGLSDKGICNLPVRFYPGYIIRKKLPSSFVFNPLPPDC